MKRILLAFAASLTTCFAELPQMSDKTEWLGYFIGWESRSSDFGIGADGESLLHPKKSGKRAGHKDISIRYIIEEEVGGKWVRRQFLKEGGLASESEKGLDPKKPVVLVTTVTGDTKVEWTHIVARGKINVMPKILDKKTENKVRVGMEFVLPRLYRFQEKPTDRELKKKVGKDYIKAVRLKDKKSVRVKFHEVEDDVTSEKFLAEGASEIEVKSEAFMGASFVIENGKDKAGRIDVKTNGPLYNSFRMTWMADLEKIGTKDCFVTFAVE